MRIARQINIKNGTYYFYNDQINLEDFDVRLLKIDKTNYREIGIYYIGYVTVKTIPNCNDINAVNPLYLKFHKMIGHLEEKNANKYLALDHADENKEVSKKKMKYLGTKLRKYLKRRKWWQKRLNMGKIFKKLFSHLMIVCQPINLENYTY